MSSTLFLSSEPSKFKARRSNPPLRHRPPRPPPDETCVVDLGAKDPQTLVKHARQVAQENSATFEGDTNSGSFSGRGVEGSYEVEGNTVKVTVTDKPTLASWSKVESKIEEFFS